LTPEERTILLARVELDALRLKRQAAKSFMKMASSCSLQWPDSFQNLPSIEGTLWEQEGGMRKVTVTEYATTGLHFTAAALFLGAPGLGKTPLAESLCARLALSYQETGEYYISTGTPDSLRKVADEGLLRPGVPVLIDEVDPGDKKQHRQRMSANFLKQLCGVASGWTIGARYADVALAPMAPRLLTSNARSAEEWLLDVNGSDDDRLAIRKRVIFFTVTEPLVPTASVAAKAMELEGAAAAGAMRLARKLGRPL
jgi:hypothetical protein